MKHQNNWRDNVCFLQWELIFDDFWLFFFFYINGDTATSLLAMIAA